MSKCSQVRQGKRGGTGGHIDVERRGRRDDRRPGRVHAAGPCIHTRRPAARVASGDALLPRRPHPGRDRVPARGLPPDSRAAGRPGQSQGTGRIDVVVPPDMRDDLHADEERELEQRYGLTEAVVAGHGIDIGAPGRPAAYASVGRAAAALLMRRLSANDVLGFTWGPEQAAVAEALSPGVASCRAVVQLDGAMSAAAYQTGTEFILGRCADVLRATTIRLPAPLYADPSTVASMRSDSLISRTLEAGRRADVMLFGVGAVSTSTTLFEGSFLDTKMLDELISLGAVGEIGGRFFDAHGVPVDTEL